jgi:hypothetical protein
MSVDGGLIGYRIWRPVPVWSKEQTGPRWELHSVAHGHGAWKSPLLQAECKSRDVTSSHLHRVPNVNCRCGIYSTYTVMGALEQVLNTKGPYIVGAVVNYAGDDGNDLLLHDGWIRSPEAEIVALANFGAAFEPASRTMQIDGKIDGMTEFVSGSFGQEIASGLDVPVVPLDGLETFAHEHGHSVELAGAALTGNSRRYIDDLHRGESGLISQHALSVDKDGRMFLSAGYSLLDPWSIDDDYYPPPFDVTRAHNGRLLVEVPDHTVESFTTLRSVLVHETDGRVEHEHGNPAFAHPVGELIIRHHNMPKDGDIALLPVSFRHRLLDFLPRNELRRVSLNYHAFTGGLCALPRYWSEPSTQPALSNMEVERSDTGWTLHLPATAERRVSGADWGVYSSPANLHEHAVTELHIGDELVARNPKGVLLPQRYIA